MWSLGDEEGGGNTSELPSQLAVRQPPQEEASQRRVVVRQEGQSTNRLPHRPIYRAHLERT